MVLQSATTVPLLNTFEQAVRASGDFLRHLGIADTIEDAFGVFGHLARVGARLGLTACRQLLRLAGCVRPQRNVVPRLDQLLRHRHPHDSETQKSKLCHLSSEFRVLMIEKG